MGVFKIERKAIIALASFMELRLTEGDFFLILVMVVLCTRA
jgi:hypothetical protein